MTIRKLHLYVALSFGLLFSLIGLSGSWLAFYPEIDSALMGFATRSTGPAHWEQTINAGEHSVNAPGGMSMLMLPWGEHGTALVLMQKGPQMASLDYGQAYVDPGSARVLMARDVVSARQGWRKNLSGVAFAIHSGFFAGALGGAAIGILALFLLFSMITGLYMWWPRGRWRASSFLFMAKFDSRAFLRELHSVSGLYASLLLGLAAVTGFHYAFQPLTAGAIASILPTAPASSGSMPTMDGHGGMIMAEGGERITADAAVARAKTLFPKRPLKSLIRMGREHPQYQIGLAPVDGHPEGVGATQVTLNAAGMVVGVQDPQRELIGNTVVRWLVPLHTGVAFGLLGRSIMAFIGLTPTLFFVTGVWIWLRREQARRRSQRNRRAAAATPQEASI